MRLNAADLLAALAQGRAAADATTRAHADNIALDECTSGERQRFFETVGFGPRGLSWRDLANRQSAYVKRYVETLATPHTFDAAMSPATQDEVDDEQYIVRLESLRTPLDDAGYTLAELAAAHADGDREFVEVFLDVWNAGRDARPAFATYKRAVADAIDAEDWPERLRDRLGLAHYSAEHAPEPVALMHYPVSAVRAEAPPGAAFTKPAVLDCRPWAHFFPAPRDLGYGRAMALTPCQGDETLVTELLHSRLTYRYGHILRIGQIERPARIADLAELRELHLWAVRMASGREDFGA